ncbi:DNA polymerase III subunits gamma and tau [Corynebacterium halotolerans YIM 70093 = DSM 44683]|uniref:DNA-directed DNA polymerase n=1 Tax=Corynebacterium halotolerans YIM 70093 = DSM 44683 TaxID=1121362 RepID=M1MU99_9CORY|nr:DNA polymerase III subunits gamma and tau [Corynebacterium halotolerans YIM 70093 = DSM 44683]
MTRPLSVALDSGRINHAYLFSGPRGCGKTSSARILARSLNCIEGPTSTPCGVCPSCVSLAPGGPGNLDVTELDAASHRGVDDMRELRDRAYFAPAESRYRVFIIDEAHMITREGSNALLKIVEEPPEHLIFIFATTEPEKVIGTIRSRTHHYPFRLLTPQAMRGLLERTVASENVMVEDSVYPLAIRAGGGSPRDTLSILDQLLAGAGPDGLTYDLALPLLGVTDLSLIDGAIDALADGDRAALFTTVDEVIEAGHEPRRFVEDLLDRLRDLMVLQAVPEALDMGLVDAPTDRAEVLRDEATRFTAAQLAHLAATVNERIADMRGATSPRLLLEILCAHLLLPAQQVGGAGAVAQATTAPTPAAAAPTPPQGDTGTDAGPGSGTSGSQRVFERRSQRLAREAAEKAAAEKAAAEKAAAEDAAAAQAPAGQVPAEPAPTERQRPDPAGPAQTPAQAPASSSAPAPAPSAEPAQPRQDPAQTGAQQSAQPAETPAPSTPESPAPEASRAPAPAQQPTAPADSDEDLVNRIRSEWAQLRSAVGRRNKVAEIMLTEAKVLGLRDDTLVLGHNTGALAERLNAGTNNNDIVAVLAEELERPLKVHCVVGTDPAAVGFSAPAARQASWNPHQDASPRENRSGSSGSPGSSDSAEESERPVSTESSAPPAPPQSVQPQPEQRPTPQQQQQSGQPDQRQESAPVWGRPAQLGSQAQPQPAAAPEQQAPAPAWGQPAALGGRDEGSGTPVPQTASEPASHEPQERPRSNWEAAAARGEAKRAERAARPAFDNGVPLPPEPDEDPGFGAAPPPDPYGYPGETGAPPQPGRASAPAPQQAPAQQQPRQPLSDPSSQQRNEEEEMMAEAARQPGNYDRRDATTIAVELLEQELGARRL